VDGVALTIREGAFFAMLGPSGSGKTTCLRLISGFEKPTGGAIRIFGQDVSDVPPNRRNVNTVFQDYALFPHMNVRDNVAYGLMVKGVDRTKRLAKAEEMLSLVKLSGYGDRKPGGRLPFELPSSMAAVQAQYADVPDDTADPLFRRGFGLSYRGHGGGHHGRAGEGIVATIDAVLDRVADQDQQHQVERGELADRALAGDAHQQHHQQVDDGGAQHEHPPRRGHLEQVGHRGSPRMVVPAPPSEPEGGVVEAGLAAWCAKARGIAIAPSAPTEIKTPRPRMGRGAGGGRQVGEGLILPVDHTRGGVVIHVNRRCTCCGICDHGKHG